MIKLDRILVPTDFSDFSRPAMQHGCAIAARFGAQNCIYCTLCLILRCWSLKQQPSLWKQCRRNQNRW
jgi:hypothetical protein